jgi:GSH-dependent disulfide-bond oxidoreductase
MIKLYGMFSPNVLKVILALEELNTPWQFTYVDVFAGDQFEEEFGNLNPNRKVPVIIDAEGPGGEPITLWESGAILLYLSEKTGKLMPSDLRKRYTVMQWLMFQMAGVGPMFGQNGHFKIYHQDHGSEYSRARYGTEVLRLYDVLERRLSESPWVGGDEYSIADIATWPWARNLDLMGANEAHIPHVVAWHERILARPAAESALRFLAEMKSVDIPEFARENPDKLDRYLGRGRFSRVDN